MKEKVMNMKESKKGYMGWWLEEDRGRRKQHNYYILKIKENFKKRQRKNILEFRQHMAQKRYLDLKAIHIEIRVKI